MAGHRMFYPLSRRTFLRGVGVTMALPWLESVAVWGDEKTSTAAGGSQPPVRFACLFSGNGFHSKEWSARGEGAQMELGKVLEPLMPFREKLLFLRGLYNQEALIGGIHSCQTGNLLTGAHLASGGEIRSGVSMDQVIAQKLQEQTKVPSLVLGCEQSIALDAVLQDASGFRGSVSRSDQHRLDEYLSSVRDVEQRIDQAGKDRRLQGWRPTLLKPDMPRPADGIPQDIDQHMRLMCDILVLAFRTDTTRVATLKLNNDHSSLRFPNLKIDYMIHHLLSHSDGADWLRVNQFFTEQVAYIARKLDAVQEGERTLLDNSMILFLSSMMTGNHDNQQLPVVMLGSGGGQVKTGRIVDYLDKPNRKMCSLYLSLMDKAGVHLESFGDSRERLAEI
jgi:hypothetical protein